ncbi:MAG: HRDC domain-containing protein [Gemmataceae bacterium]|nr:HRDC domain-containing protein [Gemmataceae bacterium]
MTRPVREVVVADPAALAACCAHLEQCPRLGLDTEFVGERSYHPELCLVQVATETALYLIDPFAFDSLDAFWKFVVSPTHLVVVHAGREEVRLCHVAFGQAPARLFDLQIAAGLVGLPYPMGHGPLVYQVLGERLAKSETLTEWGKRPLTPEQIRYAFDDVRHLLALQERLQERLERLGRMDWATEEFQRLTCQATPETPSLEAVGEKWRRLRGANALGRRSWAILRELYVWREKAALQSNRPPRAVVRDDLLVDIAQRPVQSPRDLRVIRGLAHRYLDEIYAAVERGRAVPADQCPKPLEREQDAPQLGPVVQVVQAALVDFATKHSLAPNLVAGNQDIKALVRAFQQGTIERAATSLVKGWRAAFVLPHLLAILQGRRSLRVADLDRADPFDYAECDST